MSDFVKITFKFCHFSDPEFAELVTLHCAQLSRDNNNLKYLTQFTPTT